MTITTSILAVMAAALIIAFAFTVAITTHRLQGVDTSLRTKLRAISFLERLEFWASYYGATGRMARDIKADYLAEFYAAAEAGGGETFFHHLDARHLAAQLADDTKARWARGAFYGLFAFMAGITIALFGMWAFMSAFDQLAGPGESARASFPLRLVELEATNEPDGGFSMSFGGTWVIAVVAVWLITTRPWRIASGRNS